MVTIERFLDDAHGAGVQFLVDGDALRTRAAPGAITPAMADFIRANRQAIVTCVRETEDRKRPALRRAATAGPEWPLSPAQTRFWFIDRFGNEHTRYNLPVALRMTGAFDPDRAEAALQAIVDRHAPLRRVVRERDDGQVVLRDRTQALFRLERLDLGHLPAPSRQAQLESLVVVNATAPFDLTADLLLRGAWVRLSDTEGALLLCMPHLVCDGWSLLVMQREFVEHYRALAEGRQAALAPLDYSYDDYTDWQRRWVTSEAAEEELRWWTAHLADAPPVHGLPLDRPRSLDAMAPAGWHEWGMPDEVSCRLREVAVARGMTLFMVLHAALLHVLCRQSGTRDIVIGTPVLNRLDGALEALIGCFVNTLALRVDMTGVVTFDALLRQVQAANVDAQVRQMCGFGQVVERLNPVRQSAHTPVFQIMLSMGMPKVTREQAIAGLHIEPMKQTAMQAKFDISLFAQETDEQLGFGIEYDAALFDHGSMIRLAEQLDHVLRQVADDPCVSLDDLSLGEGDETRVWEAGETVAVPVETLVEAVSRHARQTPTQRAVVYEGQALDYRTLDAWSDELAARLCAAGVEAGHRVGVQLPRSLGLPAALLAVWKAGAAYVPLDPAQPLVRRQGMAADAGLHTVVCLAADAAQWQGDGYAVVAMDAAADTAGMTVPARSGELAYVMFTSGSTGRPKGVMVGHRQVANLSVALDRVLAEGGISGACQWAWNASYAFDASLQALTQWRHGSTLHLLDEPTRQDPQRLLAYLRTEGIEVLDATPLQAETLLAACGESSLPTLLVGGEAIGQTLWQSLAAHYRGRGQAALNVYGPTETTVDATMARVEGERPTIGRPLANTWVGVLDARGRRVPVGVPGELWIGGAGVAEGYAGQASDRFVMHEIDGESRRLYRTGDRARWREDGQLDYLGRLDGQVKIRGYRIELEDVASALRRRTDVATAVVQVRGEDIHRRLLAWAVPAAATDDTSHWARTLEAALAEELPAWMVPQVVPVDALPLTPNGKLDARALPVPVVSGSATTDTPRSPLERFVADLWCQQLGVTGVGLCDEFFNLGGHSLLAARIASRLGRAFGIALPLATFFAPTVTVASICAAMERLAPVDRLEVIAETYLEVAHMDAASVRQQLVAETPA